MSKHTRKKAAESTPPDYLTAAFKVLQGDAIRRLDTLEYPLTREVSFSTDIYNVALLERLAAHCGVTPGRFAAEVFEAAICDATDFFKERLNGDLEDQAEAYAVAFKEMRFNRDRLDALVTGWKSLHVQDRQQA